MELFIRILKEEQRLEVWQKEKADAKFTLLKQYKVIAASFSPEGFYFIKRILSKSFFRLRSAIQINYPNVADINTLGFVNNKVLIGTDLSKVNFVLDDSSFKEFITILKESSVKPIPIHIFPFCLSIDRLEKERQSNLRNIDFLLNILQGYLIFEEYKQLPSWTYGRNGYNFRR